MRFLPWCGFAFLAACSSVSRAESDSPWIVEFDGLDSTQADTWGLSAVVELNRDPLFDNAPFLRLRRDDKLVYAKHQSKGSAQEGYYLVSQGKYYQVVAREKAGKLVLDDDWYLRDPLLFEWKFTLPQATALSQFESGSLQKVNLIRYAEIYNAVRKRFPDKECRSPGSVEIAADKALPFPGQLVAEFQGIAYNQTFNRLEKYVLRIGPSTCTMRAQVLIQGAPRVDRWEFDAEYVRKNNADPGENGAVFPDPDPATSKIKRAQYLEWLAFQTIVLDVISPDRVRSDEEKALSKLSSDPAEKTRPASQ